MRLPCPTPQLAQPNGDQIVFVSDVGGQEDVYTMKADGTEWKKLSDRGGANPKWSPDGSLVAFSSRMDGTREIYLVGSDGIGLRRLTNDPASDFQPNWSPDKTQIVFGSSRDGFPNLFVMDTDGQNQRRLLDTPDLAEWTPTWSPDGAKILFTQQRDGNSDGKFDQWVDTPYICILYLGAGNIEYFTEAS